MDTTNGAGWPKVTVTTNSDGIGDVNIGGTHHPLHEPSLDAARAAAARIIASTAATLGRELHVTTTDPDGTWPLIVHPDGTILEDPGKDAIPATADPTKSSTSDKADQSTTKPVSAPSTADPAARAVRGTATPVDDEDPPRPPARSFLTVQQVEPTARTGWRGVLAHLGLHISPSAAERAERTDVHAVSQHWPGPRTIAVVNGKGGAGKTPTVALLSAVFARSGGAGVLAWDTNQTRGTLGWRTEQGPHDATVLDLLPAADRLLGTGAQSADLAHFVHHQTADRFDVLRSQPIALAAEQRVTTDDVDRTWEVAAKYYRLILVDTGNDESDPVWLAALAHADQIVVPTTTRADHAEAGALLLDALRGRDQHSRQLADNAVAVVTQADPRASKTDITNIVTGYDELAREVVTIPHDPAIVDGVLQWDSLRPATQRAWLRAAAGVARGL
ncbi:MinD/ParA family protein [Propionibacterium sp.]|uniref:MinD/ParA family ATP-binding protein n=1 Tax=Propionibacterium sp. TaxID=1977903 RepID=UPI00345F082A